ncbi:hypothetical protein [Aquimarina sp. RZ0]|nr:hypothetical protein [Aquimarina sp. RZ0]
MKYIPSPDQKIDTPIVLFKAENLVIRDIENTTDLPIEKRDYGWSN